MDNRRHRHSAEKAKLIAQLSQDRRHLTRQWNEVGQAFDMPQFIRHSIRERTWQWLGGALVIGIVAGRAFMSGQKKKSQKIFPPAKGHPLASGLAGTILSASLPFLKPLLTNFAQKEIEKFSKGSLHKK